MVVQDRLSRSEEGRAGLRILVLGPLSVVMGKQIIKIASTKGRALLGYLALQSGQDVLRGHLAGLLWAERAEEQARASLRQTLSELRGAFEDAIGLVPIKAGKDTASLLHALAWVDAVEFERLAVTTTFDELSQAAT